MRIEKIPANVRTWSRAARRDGRTVGLVPTMGALHEGHLSLIRAATAECDDVAVSIFVNPTQFGPGEDLAAYPRPLEADCAAAEATGADLVFAPAVEDVYGEGACTFVEVEGLTDGLCGAHRPGHFRGVTTIVAKLFAIVEPDVSFFGRKDYQQAAVIRRMVRDLEMPVHVRVMPTVREADGLAMSSRNAYLSDDDHRRALSLSTALRHGRELVAGGERDVRAIAAAIRGLVDADSTDYVEVVDRVTLEPLEKIRDGAVAAIAAHIGRARLIDNMTLTGDNGDCEV